MSIDRWPREILIAMMNTHLSTTTNEVIGRLTKNWEQDVRAFAESPRRLADWWTAGSNI
jgi:hypothetical protein